MHIASPAISNLNRNAIGCLLVFDMTRRETFTHIQSWLDDVYTHGNENIKSIMVANKCDQESKRQVSRQEGIEFAQRHNLLYIEASAKSGKNIEEVYRM